MKRLFAILVLGLVAWPAAPANAGSGWELPQISSFVRNDKQLPNTNYGRHCGATPFGTWRFIQGVTVRGVWGAARWTVELTEDGRSHKPRKVRFVGRLPAALKRDARDLLRKVSYRYQGGVQPQVQALLPDGSVQSSRPFNPAPLAC